MVWYGMVGVNKKVSGGQSGQRGRGCRGPPYHTIPYPAPKDRLKEQKDFYEIAKQIKKYI